MKEALYIKICHRQQADTCNIIKGKNPSIIAMICSSPAYSRKKIKGKKRRE
jgi:hypothetical protein